VRADAIGVIGWSNGAMAVLALVDSRRPRPPETAAGLQPAAFRAAVAFYPSCRAPLAHGDWTSRVPLALLIGDHDDWTAPGPCRALAADAAARGAPLEFTLYAGAYHDFDYPDLPLRQRGNVASTGSGRVTLGTDPAARADALARVPAFLARVLPP
jgi:dienelactone hydrolase